ncbi:MAG TPA: sulfurtransferase TusA family protein [Candidatus Bathyarchaeia archaeon]
MVRVDEKLDVRKKICPMPALLTNRKLQTMKTGTVLEVTGDYATARENIQRLSKQHGHKVLQVVDEHGVFRIYIEKV